MSPRSRWFAALLLVAAAIALAHYAVVWVETSQSLARTSDFAGTYVAGTLWRTGAGGQMYDESVGRARLIAGGVPADHADIPFENPPAAAVLAAPVSVLDPVSAWRVWSLAQLLLLVASLAVAARAAPWPRALPRMARLAVVVIALAGFGTGLLFVEGQWDGVSALGIALGYAAWRRGNPVAAGFAVGFTAAIAKPQLVIGIAAFMLGRRDWRALAGAMAGVALTLGIALLAVGPGGIASFVAAVARPSYSPTARMEGATGLFGSLLGQGSSVFALAVAASACAAALAGWLGALARRRHDVFEPALCGAVALSLFASPHLLGHDLTLLAPALVFGVAWLAGTSGESPMPGRATAAAVAAWVILSVAALGDLGSAGVGLPGRATPWALLLVAALWALVAARAAWPGRPQLLRTDRAGVATPT